MIKSNLICTTKLSNGSTTVDLTKLTEDYKIENMKRCKTLVCCDKISNGQEVFDLSELGKATQDLSFIGTVTSVTLQYKIIESTQQIDDTKTIDYYFDTVQKTRERLLKTAPKTDGIIMLVYSLYYYTGKSEINIAVIYKDYIQLLVNEVFSTRDNADGQVVSSPDQLNCLENKVTYVACSDWILTLNDDYKKMTDAEIVQLTITHPFMTKTDSDQPMCEEYFTFKKNGFGFRVTEHVDVAAASSVNCIDHMILYVNGIGDVRVDFKEYRPGDIENGNISMPENPTGVLSWFQWNTDTRKFNLHLMYISPTINTKSLSEVEQFIYDLTVDMTSAVGSPGCIGYTLVGFTELNCENTTYEIKYDDINFYSSGKRLCEVSDPYFTLTLGNTNEYDGLLELPFLSI